VLPRREQRQSLTPPRRKRGKLSLVTSGVPALRGELKKKKKKVTVSGKNFPSSLSRTASMEHNASKERKLHWETDTVFEEKRGSSERGGIGKGLHFRSLFLENANSVLDERVIDERSKGRENGDTRAGRILIHPFYGVTPSHCGKVGGDRKGERGQAEPLHGYSNSKRLKHEAEDSSQILGKTRWNSRIGGETEKVNRSSLP